MHRLPVLVVVLMVSSVHSAVDRVVKRSQNALIRQTVLELMSQTQCLTYFRNEHSADAFEFDFPVQLLDKRITRTELELLPECSWFLFYSKAEEISQFLVDFGDILPKSGKYLIVLTDTEEQEAILKLNFFKKVTRAVEFHSAERKNLIKSVIRTFDGIKPYNYWNGSRFLLDKPVLPEPTQYFGGRVLRCTTFHRPPETVLDSDGQYTQGFEPKIMGAVSKSLNFKMDIYPPPNGELWGEFKNGAWSGLVGQLSQEKAEIGWLNFYVKLDRMEFIGFTEPYNSESVCFMYKKPPPPPQWTAVILPLDMLTWIFSICACIIGAVLLSIITAAKSTVDPLIEISLSLLMMFGSIIDRSCGPLISIQSPSVRTFMGIWLLMALIISSGYKGMLMSVMTVPMSPVILDTISEVAATKELPVISFGDTFKKMTLESTNLDLQTIGKKYMPHYNFGEAWKNTSDGITFMAEGNGNLVYGVRKDYTNEVGVSSLHILKECMFNFNIAIGVQKDSIYNARISAKILQLKEAGLVNHWRKIEVDKVGKEAAGGTSSEATPLTLDNIQVALLLWAFFMPVATLTFIIEMSIQKCKTYKKE